MKKNSLKNQYLHSELITDLCIEWSLGETSGVP
jgi:hypothetical protein